MRLQDISNVMVEQEEDRGGFFWFPQPKMVE